MNHGYQKKFYSERCLQSYKLRLEKLVYPCCSCLKLRWLWDL